MSMNIKYVDDIPETMNQKYVEFDMFNSKYTFVKSHCGTGKTYQIVKNIKKLLETKPAAKVLFISCRISFSHCIT